MKAGLQGGLGASVLTAAAILSGCLQTTTTGTILKKGESGTSGAQTSGASSGTSVAINGANSSGSGSAASSTGSISETSGSSKGSSTGSGSGIGTGTGTGGGSPFADGGYVFCTYPGLGTWLCASGTYFCDPADAGVCFQCLSDADCADQGRPTYDPKRPRCDLQSGITGYQNFCQGCLSSADCVANTSGPLCDISPTYPPSPIFERVFSQGGSLEPSIVDLGFETCGSLQADCRLDGGPICSQTSTKCDPDSGVCVSPSGACATDADCVGLFSGNSFPLLPEPYCAMDQCSSCLDGVCPESYCGTDSACINPASPAGVAACQSFGICGCLSDLQCSGLWPRCELLDAGYTNDAGAPLGICGCDQDAQCGDAGWVCFNGVCEAPCTAPDAPTCSNVVNRFQGFLGDSPTPICNPSTGLCEGCGTSQQCQAEPGSGGPICSDAGLCGCLSDSDCPAGNTCQLPSQGNFFEPQPGAICVPSVLRCTPGSCGPLFCDWETGECVLDAGWGSFNPYGQKECLTDYDCATTPLDPPFNEPGGSFCDPVAHLCGTCNTDADCASVSNAVGLHCFKIDAGDAICGCLSDADCAGLAATEGPHCYRSDAGGPGSCGCASDADCAGNPAGFACDTSSATQATPSCGCSVPSDCQPGQACLAFYLGLTSYACGTLCGDDTGCNAGYACDPSDNCRARCDGQPCPANQPVCDSADVAGQNDRAASGVENGVTWCYQCLSSGDCGSSGCDSKAHVCGYCERDADCPAGDACRGQCIATCDAGPCPPGQVCDTSNENVQGTYLGPGSYLCHDCVSPIDCPNGEGCSEYTLTCGRCYGPNDCPPDDICSNYWSGPDGQDGVCLASCDLVSCPADRPICAVLPALTPDHKYCFGCLQDSDCASLGANAWCDVSVNLTFTCQVAP